MDRELRKGLKWSLCVHGTLVVLLILHMLGGGTGDSEKGAGDKHEEIMVEIVEPPQKEQTPEVTIEDVEDIGIDKTVPHIGDDCDNFYGGIGITVGFNGKYSTIEEVSHGYPAYRAGLRTGDLIASDDHDIRGEIGTQVKLLIIRNGETHTYTLTRDKICTSIPRNRGENP